MTNVIPKIITTYLLKISAVSLPIAANTDTVHTYVSAVCKSFRLNEYWKTTNAAVHCPQLIVFPDPEQRKLSFDKHCYEHPFDFYFVSDFESILIKNQDNSTNVINTHETAGFCLHRMTSHLVFEKGHFPYAYFDSLKRLDETTLPPKSAFLV